MRKVTIRGKEWILKHSLRTLFLYEDIAGKPYDGAKTMDIYVLMYACLIANNADFSLEFSAFIDACDEDASIFETYMAMMDEVAMRESERAESKKKEVVMP